MNAKQGMVAVLMMFAVETGIGQVVVPAHPEKFQTRPIGPSNPGTGVAIIPKEQPPAAPDIITHLTLAGERQWTSSDGRKIVAKLIAFEDMVTKDRNEEIIPPSHPTVVREDSIRLLIGRKTSVVPLARFAEEDREFVRTVRERFEKKE